MRPRTTLLLTRILFGLLLLSALDLDSANAQVEGGLGPSASSVAPAAFYYISKPGEITMSINLWGMVRQPGRYEVPISTDMVQLLSYAGGPLREADLSEVQVTRIERRDDSIRKVEFYIDLRRLQRLDAQALTLRPGDTIFLDAKFSTGDFFNILTTVAVLVTAVASAIAIGRY